MVWRLFIIGVILLTTGCQHTYQKTHSPLTPPPPIITQTLQLPAFTRVYMQGKFNVTLHTGAMNSRVIIHGNSQDLIHIKKSVRNNTLIMTLTKPYPRYGAINVDIFTRNLTSFEYHGAGTIAGHHLRSSSLDLVIENNGKTSLSGQLGIRKLVLGGDGYTEIRGINSSILSIKLSGKQRFRTSGFINLASLDMDNESWISLYWIKSNALTVRGKGNAYIQLAGAVEHLDVELWNAARFKGRYLRAERAFVKTHGQSLAEISAVRRQHALAKDASDIQFFNIPVMKADFMANNGAVLDMRDLGLPFIQEYDQYNK